jgi:hypothetical protein
MATSSYKDRVLDHRAHQKYFTLDEPGLSAFCQELRKRVTQRLPPFPSKQTSTTYRSRWKDHHIKEWILQLHPEGLKLLTSGTLENIVSAEPSPFPVTSKSYSGVYIGGFVHKDGTGITVRDAVLITNILISPRRLRTAIEGCSMGETTWAAAKKMGKSWKRTLEEIQLWREVTEDEAEWEDSDDENLESSDENADGPRALSSKSFSVPVPMSPIYVGYGQAPDIRVRDHHGGTTLLDILQLTAAPAKIKGLNHLLNHLVNHLFPAGYLAFTAKTVWSSWHLNQAQGQVSNCPNYLIVVG